MNSPNLHVITLYIGTKFAKAVKTIPHSPTMSDCLFPLEILEKFASHLDGHYAAQARMCLVSRALHNFTRPRLYHSFSSITLAGTPQTNGAAHAAYLKTIIHNRHLAALVHDYTLLVTPQSVQWPRDVPIALLSMPNLKELALINRNPEEPSHHLDLFRYVFDSDRKPFQLTSFRLHWLGSNNGRVFESMMLSTFLSKQTTIEDLHLSYHTALTGERDLPNLRKATIDWSNWEYVVPGRPLKSLIVEGDMGSARSVLKKTIVPGSPLDRTLQNLKYLHMDAQVMDALSLPQHLSSLEVLISFKFEVC